MFEYQSWRFWRRVYYVLIGAGVVILILTLWYSVYSLRRGERLWEENQRATLRDQVLPVLAHGYQQTVRLRVQSIEDFLMFLSARMERAVRGAVSGRPGEGPTLSSEAGYRLSSQGQVIRVEGTDDEILVSRSLARDPEAWRLIRASEALVEDFRTLRRQYPFVTYFYVVARGFMRIYPRVDLARTYGPDFEPSGLGLFQLVGSVDPTRRRVLWTAPYPDVTGRGWVLTAAMPIYGSDGAYQGLVAADITLTAFSEILRNPVIEQVHAVALIFNESGHLVSAFPPTAARQIWGSPWPPATPEVGATGRSPLPIDGVNYPFRLEVLDRQIRGASPVGATGQSPQVQTVRLADEEYWVAHQNLAPTDWQFFLLVPTRAWAADGWVTRQLKHSLWTTAGMAIVLFYFYLLAVLVVHSYMERRVFQPLAAIGEALDQGREVVPPDRALRPVERLAQTIRDYQQSIQESIDRLRRTMEENRLTLQTVQEAYVRLDAQGRIQDVNPAFESLFRRSREALMGAPLESLFGEDSRFFIRHRIPLWAQEPEVIQQPIEIHTGQVLHLLFSASPLAIDGQTTGIVLFIRDMTALHQFEVQLTHMSTTDPLTGLMNRRLFMESLELMIRQAWQRRRSFSIVIVNVDYFRMIVSQHGVAVADGLLRSLPGLIEWPENALAARYGDDEIAVLLPDTALDGAQRWAEEVRRRVEQAAFPVQDRTLRITVSCSVVGFPDHGQSLSELIGHSYMAMQRAKQMGGNRVVTPKQTFPLRTQWYEWAERPRQLLELKEQGRLIPFLQPIVYLHDHKVLGFELLARIIENQDVISAQEFLTTWEALPPLDQIELDVYLYRKALGRLHRYPGVCAFLNLSPAFIVLPAQFQRVCQEIVQMGVDPHGVVFEISERSILRDIEGLRRMIYAAREYGFRFAVDDFGSGFSSFQYFRVLPIDFLKIDGSYVIGLHRSLDNRRFLEAFIYLAHHFDIEIIAEHVQHPEDLEILRDMGIPLGQGILLGQPMPYDQWDITRVITHQLTE
ncbi:Cyclic di-GMP phosphodiesterase PdeB [bacterium HR11]|nr:Cyclic di-GMP phosphodiesterase PdeB [bacterium HR11]